jgi:hypothetical protein
MEKKSIIEVMEDTLRSEDDLYSESETTEEAITHINNMVKLSQAITEAKKVENDRYKTDVEAELKDRMNERDNQVKKDIADADRKQRQTQMIADKSESALTIGLNVAKVAATAAVTGAILNCECNGYTPGQSKAFRSLSDLGKLVIGKRF